MKRASHILPIFVLVFGFLSFRPYPLTSPHLSTPRVPASVPRTRPWTHAHNDYEHAHPLWDALANHFDSVEADIWLDDRGELMVSHMGLAWVGSLRELYLDPLQKLVREKGSVYGDGESFLLWLDVKERKPEMVAAIQAMLKSYPTLFPRPVTAILTGVPIVKRSYAKHTLPLLAERDEHEFAESDPVALGAVDPWKWYSLDWFWTMDWDGEGEIPDGEARKLAALVAGIHAKGRKLRIWNTPDTEGVWRASVEAGVDLLNANNLPGLREFLDHEPLRGLAGR